MKQFNCLLLASLVMICHVMAQSGETGAIPIGSRVSNFSMTYLQNNPGKIEKLYDLKGKLVILDFWNTHCMTCVESFPKLDSIQHYFGDKIQIVLVDDENPKIIQAFLDRRKKISGLSQNLPLLHGDSALARLLPHDWYPTYAFIDDSGILRARVGYYEMTKENIQHMLENKSFTMKAEIDDVRPLDFNKPLFIDGNGGPGNNLMFYSVLASHDDSLNETIAASANDSNGYHLSAVNVSAKELYQMAYEDNPSDQWLSGLVNSRVSLNIKDTTKLVNILNGVYQIPNGYIYQLLSRKKVSIGQMQKIMRSDLDHFFGLSVHWESRVMKCLILTSDDTSLIRSKGGADWVAVKDYYISVRNSPVWRFWYMLQYGTDYDKSPYPILDETGYHGNIDLELQTMVTNRELLDSALQKYKMHFKIEERMLPVLIITEPQPSADSHHKSQTNDPYQSETSSFFPLYSRQYKN